MTNLMDALLDMANEVYSPCTAARSFNIPDADMYETTNGYMIMMDVPGIPQEQLDISIKDNILTIASKKAEQNEQPKDEVKYLLCERHSQTFKRSFCLPKDANADETSAKLENGVLTIAIAKKEEAQPRTINIVAA